MAGARRQLTSVWGLFTAMAFLMLGNGLLGTLLGVRSHLEGFATTATGVILAFYYVGFLVGSQWAPAVLTRVGHVRVFAALASLMSTAALVHVVWISEVTWSVMRLVAGFSMAGLYVVAESWLNDRASNHTRGRLLSAYMVVVMGGLGLGQLLLGAADPGGFELFLMASVLVSLSVLPVALSAQPTPSFTVPARIGARAVWQAAPLGLVGAAGTGMANGALLAMGPVFAASAGLSHARVAVFMGVAILGSVVAQVPIGALSDRMPRYRLILVVTWVAAGVAVLAVGLEPGGAGLLGIMFLFGGLTFPMYSLSLAYVNDLLPEGQAVAASSVLVFVTGLGAIAGPLFGSALMAGLGPSGFYWSLAAIHAGVGIFALYRLARRRSVWSVAPRPHLNVPARATALIIDLFGFPKRNGR